jgi:hypothetical protein
VKKPTHPSSCHFFIPSYVYRLAALGAIALSKKGRKGLFLSWVLNTIVGLEKTPTQPTSISTIYKKVDC